MLGGALFFWALILVKWGLEGYVADNPRALPGWMCSPLFWGPVTIVVVMPFWLVLRRLWRRISGSPSAEHAKRSEGEAAQDDGEDGEVSSHQMQTQTTLEGLSRELARMGRHPDPEKIKPLIDRVLSRAIALHASDVHFEPAGSSLMIRFRIDGTLVDAARLPIKMHRNLFNRLKVMSNLTPFERAVPQDGRVVAKIAGRAFDIRISFLPTINGEKSVLRILESDAATFDVTRLGFSKRLLADYCDLLTRPQGIIFVTGPTGSGKTTTMYASLNYIKAGSDSTINIVAIEDPVEYVMAGFSQTQVNEEIGLSFSKGLRTILRQDPDVIMVGEIRDLETAQVALQAGLTGHLMLTTVHAESTVGVFTRLVNMGIEPFQLASAATGVLSLRLVRRLCEQCRQVVPLTPRERSLLGEVGMDLTEGAQFYSAAGCDVCLGTGFSGRSLIAELLTVKEEMRGAIINNEPAGELARHAREAGMTTLLEDGLRKAIAGTTSVAEVLRVTR